MAGAGELDLTVPRTPVNGSAQPRYGPDLAPRIGLDANAQTGAKANWQWQFDNAVTGYQVPAEYQLPIDEAS